jgi:hypothetical protein
MLGVNLDADPALTALGYVGWMGIDYIPPGGADIHATVRFALLDP